MRETSVSDEDLAIVSAKQHLATLKDRAGYLEAIRPPPTSATARILLLGASAGCAGLAYACKLYVTAAWLMWLLIVMFGALACLCAFVQFGLSPSLDKRFGVAVVEKQLVEDKRRIVFLDEQGTRLVLDTNEQVYNMLRPGDLGVLVCSGSAPDYTIDSFKRL